VLPGSVAPHQPGKGDERGGRAGMPLAPVLIREWGLFVHRRIVLVAAPLGRDARYADRGTAPALTRTARFVGWENWSVGGLTRQSRTIVPLSDRTADRSVADTELAGRLVVCRHRPEARNACGIEGLHILRTAG
jgi:hypothetical protein